MAEQKYWRKILTSQNCIHEDINPLNTELNLICHLLALFAAHRILHVSRVRVNSKLNSLNTYYHSVQNPLPFYLLLRNIKIKIYGTLISLVVLCGCETWSHIERKENRLEVFENRVLRKLFGPEKDEVTGY